MDGGDGGGLVAAAAEDLYFSKILRCISEKLEMSKKKWNQICK